MQETFLDHSGIAPQGDPLRPVSCAIILDLDDTLFDTERSVAELLQPILERYGIPAHEIEAARQAAHRDGNRSLDIVDYIVQKCGRAAWNDVSEEYVQRGKTLGLLLPGAQLLIDFLTAAHVPFGINTYGNPVLQTMKRRVIDLPNNIPFCVIDHRKKGEVLARMYNDETARFEIDWLGVAAQRVALVENDPTAFGALEAYIQAGSVLPVWIPTTRDRQKPIPTGVVENGELTSVPEILDAWIVT